MQLTWYLVNNQQYHMLQLINTKIQSNFREIGPPLIDNLIGTSQPNIYTPIYRNKLPCWGDIIYLFFFSENLSDNAEPVNVGKYYLDTDAAAAFEDRNNPVTSDRRDDRTAPREATVGNTRFESSLPPPQLAEVKLLKTRFEQPPTYDNSRPVKV